MLFMLFMVKISFLRELAVRRTPEAGFIFLFSTKTRAGTLCTRSLRHNRIESSVCRTEFSM